MVQQEHHMQSTACRKRSPASLPAAASATAWADASAAALALACSSQAGDRNKLSGDC
jgi:hypothetical protein